MPPDQPHTPRSVPQVMVSSTFTDLEHHRAALIKSINQHELHAKAMENDSANLLDVLDSSLTMVRVSAAYVGVIGQKYGQVPECPARNPDGLSLTELEFNEAQRLGRPTLLFIMGDQHPVTKADIERDLAKEAKLDAFRERAKKASADSKVDRVYAVFESLEEFKSSIAPSLAKLGKHLDRDQGNAPEQEPSSPKGDQDTPIPTPPTFYAQPDYIGSHQFVGRADELARLTRWAKPADPTNLLLFEAIGGNGKSMLTWQWATAHATKARDDWAGRFWYSFYERGANMDGFCRHGMAYMTGRPFEEFRTKRTAELREPLLAELHKRPWLLVLDGLERVLVAYHRIDAAELRDEDIDSATDQIAKRNPRSAIRDEDDELLRALAGAQRSKILVSSRLTPRVLLNPSGQPIPGAKRLQLEGLNPDDAEALLRSCGVGEPIRGDSGAIQRYLTANCDNHPLVIGVIGGLINNYLPARGDFDAWADDPKAGAAIDFTGLDLAQRRNHILDAAMAGLPEGGRQLLTLLSLLSEAVDYETLAALNPHLPPEPDAVFEPTSPKDRPFWDGLPEQRKARQLKAYELKLAKWKAYQTAMDARTNSNEFREAPKRLAETIADLEERGLLQYDHATRRYDLHPVVRGVAAGRMAEDDKQRHGQRVVDHFSSMPQSPYEQAQTVDDVAPGLHVVRTLLKLGYVEQAAEAYGGDLANALEYNLEAYSEMLGLLRPFFPEGWNRLPAGVSNWVGSYLVNDVAIALRNTGAPGESLGAHESKITADLESRRWESLFVGLWNVSDALSDQNMLARMDGELAMVEQIAVVLDDADLLYVAQLGRFKFQIEFGRFAEATATWRQLDLMDPPSFRGYYRPGMAEASHAAFMLSTGVLNERQLAEAERLAARGNNRLTKRELCSLRGQWRLGRDEWAPAESAFATAVHMARERGLTDATSETGLALAKHHLGTLTEPRHEAERLARLRDPAHRYLAELWLAIGDRDEARRHALKAYRWAWADGEPYVRRYELNQTTELLERMGVPIPDLPHYDPDKDEPMPWEAEVKAAIEELRAEKEREKAEAADEDGDDEGDG